MIYCYRPPSKDLVRDRLKVVGKRIGVKVSPHRLRHTFAHCGLDNGGKFTRNIPPATASTTPQKPIGSQK
jgi:integrase